MNNKWMAFILVLLCFIITSGCTPPVSNNDTQNGASMVSYEWFRHVS